MEDFAFTKRHHKKKQETCEKLLEGRAIVRTPLFLAQIKTSQ